MGKRYPNRIIISYFDNGNKYQEGIINNGKQNGEWRLWKENGQNHVIRSYNNGEIVNEWTYYYKNYDNGTKKIIGLIKKDENDKWIKDGEWNEWNETGLIKSNDVLIMEYQLKY
jgi:antitoxin component YwqK of YwqJK toxin-antitoxin module